MLLKLFVGKCLAVSSDTNLAGSGRGIDHVFGAGDSLVEPVGALVKFDPGFSFLRDSEGKVFIPACSFPTAALICGHSFPANAINSLISEYIFIRQLMQMFPDC